VRILTEEYHSRSRPREQRVAHRADAIDNERSLLFAAVATVERANKLDRSIVGTVDDAGPHIQRRIRSIRDG
jgi:hypothetical protein